MKAYAVVENTDYGVSSIDYVSTNLEKVKKYARDESWKIYTRWHSFWERFLKKKGHRETLYKRIGHSNHIITYYDNSSPRKFSKVRGARCENNRN